jgi:hypothetical protein
MSAYAVSSNLSRSLSTSSIELGSHRQRQLDRSDRGPAGQSTVLRDQRCGAVDDARDGC